MNIIKLTLIVIFIFSLLSVTYQVIDYVVEITTGYTIVQHLGLERKFDCIKEKEKNIEVCPI